MQLMLMHPFGLWALTAVAAVLIIHILQRKRRQLEITTLFLLPAAKVEDKAGSVWSRLRNSANLWLQLLAAVLFALALAQPTLTPPKSQQTVAVILDNRVSMNVFAAARHEALQHHLGTIARDAEYTHWLLMDSATGRRPIYEGDDLQALLRAANQWSPSGLHSNLERTLAVVRQRLSSGGRAIVFTDRTLTLPPGVASVGIGKPTDNVGFLTHEVRRDEAHAMHWRAWVRNYSDQPATRQWWIELADGERSPTQRITIPADAARIIEGTFPPAAERIVVALEDDALPHDNRLHLQRPARPAIAIGYNSEDPLAPFFQRLVRSMPNATRATDNRADLVLQSALTPQTPAAQPTVIFMTAPAKQPAATVLHPTVSTEHPLSHGLSWDGLLSGPTLTPATAADQVLAWRSEESPLLLRPSGQHNDLIINFDLQRSNADRLPGFIALLHRFAESVRAQLPHAVADNWATGQRLSLHFDAGATSLRRISSTADGETSIVTTPAAAISSLRAPDWPGFFSVEADATTIASGAAQFSMIAQADLRGCSAWQDFTGFGDAPIVAAAAPRTSLVPLLLLALIGTLIGAWKTAEAGQ